MKSQDFKAHINDSFEFENLSLDDLNVVTTAPGVFHVLHHDRSYNAELVSADYPAKLIALRVNGTLYQVRLSDPYDQLVSRLGLAAVGAQVVKEVRAPMPGLVLQINVREGDKVEKGKALLILEAMKMENIIKSPGDGIVKRVNVGKGQPVDKNQILVEMD